MPLNLDDVAVMPTHKDYLFVGGPLDGERRPVVGEMQRVTGASLHSGSWTYIKVRLIITEGGKVIEVYRHDSMTDAALVERLVKGYQRVPKSKRLRRQPQHGTWPDRQYVSAMDEMFQSTPPQAFDLSYLEEAWREVEAARRPGDEATTSPFARLEQQLDQIFQAHTQQSPTNTEQQETTTCQSSDSQDSPEPARTSSQESSCDTTGSNE